LKGVKFFGRIARKTVGRSRVGTSFTGRVTLDTNSRLIKKS
jgi:hypothetical protein